MTINDQQLERAGSNWVALDAGGTMTDAVIVSPDGQFLVSRRCSHGRTDRRASGLSNNGTASGDSGLKTAWLG